MTENVEGQGTSGAEDGQPNVSLGTEVTVTCVEITERYRSGVITKVTAVLELQDAIHDDTATYHQALAAYTYPHPRQLRTHQGTICP